MSANSKAATSTDPSSGTGGMTLTNVPPPSPPPPAAPVSKRPRYNLSWESNWSIGRTAERLGIKVKEYDRKDRWLAWRKRGETAKRIILLKKIKKPRKQKNMRKNHGKVPKSIA